MKVDDGYVAYTSGIVASAELGGGDMWMLLLTAIPKDAFGRKRNIVALCGSCPGRGRLGLESRYIYTFSKAVLSVYLDLMIRPCPSFCHHDL